MLDSKNLEVAKNLAKRMKSKFDVELSPQKQEFDRLFFWILDELGEDLFAYTTSKQKMLILSEIGDGVSGEFVSFGIGGYPQKKYSPLYVYDEEFYQVLREIRDAFNDKLGKQYKAVLRIEDDKHILEIYANFTLYC